MRGVLWLGAAAGLVLLIANPADAAPARLDAWIAAKSRAIEALGCGLDDIACLDKELILREQVDQLVRDSGSVGGDCMDGMGFRTPAGCEIPALGVDRDNSARIRAIVARYGFPHGIRWTRAAVQATWKLCQHAITGSDGRTDVDLQRSVLPEVRKAVAERQLTPWSFAAMSDRIALASGRPQTYGTQYACENRRPVFTDLADPDGVEARRSAIGVYPFAETIVAARLDCGLTGDGG